MTAADALARSYQAYLADLRAWVDLMDAHPVLTHDELVVMDELREGFRADFARRTFADLGPIVLPLRADPLLGLDWDEVEIV